MIYFLLHSDYSGNYNAAPTESYALSSLQLGAYLVDAREKAGRGPFPSASCERKQIENKYVCTHRHFIYKRQGICDTLC